MLKKPYKIINEVKIFGNNQWREMEYGIPEWKEKEEEFEEELFFTYKGNKYFLSEIIAVHNEFYNPHPPDWMSEFDGFMPESYFNGILIKLSDDMEKVKVYTYII